MKATWCLHAATDTMSQLKSLRTQKERHSPRLAYTVLQYGCFPFMGARGAPLGMWPRHTMPRSHYTAVPHSATAGLSCIGWKIDKSAAACQSVPQWGHQAGSGIYSPSSPRHCTVLQQLADVAHMCGRHTPWELSLHYLRNKTLPIYKTK